MKAALAEVPAFEGVAEEVIDSLARSARIKVHETGDVILDAFRQTPRDVVLVLNGTAQVWTDAERPHRPEAPELLYGPGDTLGVTATLTGKAIGPLAVASGVVRGAHIPAAAVDRALAGRSVALRRPPDRAELGGPSTDGLRACDLVTSRPLSVSGTVSVATVAAAMGRRGIAAVECVGSELMIVTDRSLRERVLAVGLPPDTPVRVAAVDDLPWVAARASAADALILLIDNQADHVLVRADDGGLLGSIDALDFIGSSVTAGLTVHERCVRAGSVEELKQLADRLPQLLGHLLEEGSSPARVLSLYSALVDAIIRRTLSLVMERHPELSPEAFSWLSMGSNGRRESTLSSDVDCAVVFHDDLPQAEIDRYRTVFLKVVKALAVIGLTGDDHGATAAHRQFARSRSSWVSSARAWVEDPTRDNAAMLTSLLLDSRPINGGAALPEVTDLFAGLRRNPGTMRLLLTESLAHRAGMYTLRRRLGGPRERFDLKQYALLPMVNLARWAALTVGCTALPTTERLRAASGTSVLPERQASILIEVFEVLQAIRLRSQLDEVAAGRPPTDRLNLNQVSPIDHSIIVRAVKEIAAAQQRMANLGRYEDPQEWGLPEPQLGTS